MCLRADTLLVFIGWNIAQCWHFMLVREENLFLGWYVEEGWEAAVECMPSCSRVHAQLGRGVSMVDACTTAAIQNESK